MVHIIDEHKLHSRPFQLKPAKLTTDLKHKKWLKRGKNAG